MENGELTFTFTTGTVLCICQPDKPFAVVHVELLAPCAVVVRGIHSKQELRELLLGNDRDTYSLNNENLQDS
jgi:hypothetical protein